MEESMTKLNYQNVIERTQCQIPETYQKGETFESYVREYLFPKEKYRVVDKTHNYLENKNDYIERTKDPDFKFRSSNGKVFYVETKYRSYYLDGAIKWCKKYQLLRYREVDQRIPVYIVIGTGEHPNNPTQLFFIPLRHIRYVKLYPSFLQRYSVPIKEEIIEDKLNY
jgi:hypothetical protein